MSDEYTQEFRDEVLDWTEIASMAGVFAAVAKHDEWIRAETVRVTAEKIAGYVRGEAGGPDSVLFEVADDIRATFGLAADKPVPEMFPGTYAALDRLTIRPQPTKETPV